MAIATGLVSALLAFAVQAVNADVSAPEPTCPSTPYYDAWGRTSPSGLFQLCRVPGTSAAVSSIEYELRSGEQRLWVLALPHALGEAVVSESGEVDGYAIVEESRPSAATAYVVAIAPDGLLRREWRFGVESKWIAGGANPPPVTGIARIDPFRLAVRTGYDEVWTLELDSAAPVRSFDLRRFPGGPGEARTIAEWHVLPGAEVVAIRTAYGVFHVGTPTGPLGALIGGRTDLGMRYSVLDSGGRVLWSLSDDCLTASTASDRSPLEAFAEQAFRQDRSEHIEISSGSPIAVDVRTSGTSLRIEVSKDLSGAWQASVVGGR